MPSRFLYLALAATLRLLGRRRRGLARDAGIVILRHELVVPRRSVPRPRLARSGRALLAALARQCPDRRVGLAPAEGPIRCHKGLMVIARHTLPSAPAMDGVIVPGGDGTFAFANDELGPWLRTWHGPGLS